MLNTQRKTQLYSKNPINLLVFGAAAMRYGEVGWMHMAWGLVEAVSSG